MITIRDFSINHIEEAQRIALTNFREERSTVTDLPEVEELPNLERFAENGLGAAAFGNNGMLGFLCCYKPWNNAFNTTAKGTFSPIHAHAAVLENRGMLYKRLYQAAAEKWVNEKITSHAVALYAHDTEAIKAFFTYGFGLRCIDAIRPLINLNNDQCEEGINIRELAKHDVAEIRELRKLLSDHLSESPCFMRKSPENYEEWIKRAEARDSRVFVARRKEKPVAYMEIKDGGENFAAEVTDMKNICCAYCLPEYRGKGISQVLLDFIISELKGEGYKRLGVDFESFNPNAYGFWLKHFTPYTYSVVRRIDECALGE